LGSEKSVLVDWARCNRAIRGAPAAVSANLSFPGALRKQLAHSSFVARMSAATCGESRTRISLAHRSYACNAPPANSGRSVRRRRGDNSPKKSYPRPKKLTDNARASIHEGRLRRRLGMRVEGGGRERVQHAHPRRGSRSRSGPGAPAARHWGLLAAGRTGGANRPGLSRPPQRWLGGLRESRAARKGKATGGRAAEGFNTARGTSEKWRTCGTTKPNGI